MNLKERIAKHEFDNCHPDSHNYVIPKETIYQQLKRLNYEDIIVELDKYPIVCEINHHLKIISKKGLGIYRVVTSSTIMYSPALSEEELNRFINCARRFFKNIELHCKYSMRYILIEFPDVQEYMDLEGFEEHSSLADCYKFGSAAYFVEEEWLVKCLEKEK